MNPSNTQSDFDLMQILARPLEEVIYTTKGISKPKDAVFISKMNDTERRLFHFMRECELSELRFEKEALPRVRAYAELRIVSPDSSELAEQEMLLAVDELRGATLKRRTSAAAKLFWGAIEMRLSSTFVEGHTGLCVYEDDEIGSLKSSREED